MSFPTNGWNFPTWLYCGWMQTANLVVLWMNGLPTWFYFMCHFYYFELWIGEGYVFKPVLASYWKRQGPDPGIREPTYWFHFFAIPETEPPGIMEPTYWFHFFAIPDPEPTWPGMSVLDTLIIPYQQGINFTKSNTLPMPWWGPITPTKTLYFSFFHPIFSSFFFIHKLSSS
jgi:hypothetical protein